MAIDITGTAGDDVINDTVAGAINGPGGVSLVQSINASGLSGFDSIYGSTNFDTLFGNAGDDLILGNGGSDTIFGGQGNDELYLTGVASSTTEPALAIRAKVVGGQGLDEIYVGGTTAARDSAADFGGAFIGQVTVIGGSEALDREDQGDFIDVNLGANSYAEIYSNGGNDTVSLDGVARPNAGELGSRFYVHAGQGNDQIYGYAGTNSTIFGGVGADSVEVEALNAVTIYGGNGNADAVDGNDRIFVEIGADGFVPEGFVSTALVTGNGGSDTIYVVTPDEAGVQASIYGGQGFDSIFAGGGFFGESMSGGLASNSFVAGGLGTDVIQAIVSGTNVSILGGNGTTDPSDGTDIVYVGIQEEGSAQVFGNGGDDFLLVYGPGSSTVYGGAGDDTLVVSNQNDDQNFVPESVVLTGGQGSDLFQIEARQEDREVAPIVRITDFNFDEDFIAGNQVDDLVAVSGRANNFDDILDLSQGAIEDGNAAIVTIGTGALAGTYLVYSTDSFWEGSQTQVVNITGYTGTADADVFADAVNNLA